MTRSLSLSALLIALFAASSSSAQDAPAPGPSAPEVKEPATQAPEPSEPTEGAPQTPDVPQPPDSRDPASAAAAETTPPLPTDPSTTATSSADASALNADLIAELNAAAAAQNVGVEEPELIRLYGFFDVGARYIYDTDGAPQGRQVLFNHTLRESGGWTFVPTATNLYIDTQPLPSTRGLIELRFMLQGASRENSRSVVTVADETSPYGFGLTSAALLSIERAQIEHHVFDWLQFRAGMWLTPSGIWNEDHGIPTLISMWLPQFMLQEQIPLRQVGVQAFGGIRFGDYRLDYNAYVSNGRTYEVANGGRKASERELFDYDSDKAFGYRLKLSRSYPFYYHFGTSFYSGSYEEMSREVQTVTGPGVGKVKAFSEYSIAFDAALDYKGLRLRSEFIVTSTRYEPGFESKDAFGNPMPDNNAYDGYLTVAYRLPAFVKNLEPYLYWEMARRPSMIGDSYALGSLGFNYYINRASQLKFQWISTAFFDWDSSPGVAWIGLPTRANDFHTGKDQPFATGTPGGVTAHYVLTF